MQQSSRLNSHASSKLRGELLFWRSFKLLKQHLRYTRLLCAIPLLTTGNGVLSQDLSIDISSHPKLELQEVVISPYLQTAPAIEIPSPNFLTMYYEFGLTEDLIEEIKHLLNALNLDGCSYSLANKRLAFVCYCHSSTVGIRDNYWFQTAFHFSLDARSGEKVSHIAADVKMVATSGSRDKLDTLAGRLQNWERLGDYTLSQLVENHVRSRLEISLRSRYVKLPRISEND